MKIHPLVYYFILCCFACNAKKEYHNYLFNMGPETIVKENGFITVTPSDRYTRERGYGWIIAPGSAFDSVNLKYGIPFLSSGVLAPDSIIFRADVDNGEYFVTVTAGGRDDQPLKMHISINQDTLADSLVTATNRITHKTFRHKIRIEANKVTVNMSSASTAVGLYSIEIRSVAPYRDISFESTVDQDTAAVQKFAQQLMEAEKRDTGNIPVRNQLEMVNKYLKACYYYNGGGWLWAVRSTGMSLIHRLNAAVDLLEQICADPRDPLYYRAVYLLGKIHYWLDQEDKDAYHEQQSRKYFDLLRTVYPDNQILKMYLGERIPHISETGTSDSGAPLWATLQRETMHRMLELIHWWVNIRQAPNGEMGGKYGDDVELLRWWLPAILGADDSTALIGYKRLADGVWNSDLLERGFSRRIDDVEHSAELFRDTHPGMFLLNYGDPEYVERCMLSMQNFRDVWTGITTHGHRHFRSYYLSATKVLEDPPFGVDIPLNARAALPGLWAAWYNNNPDIIRLFKEWAAAWIEDADRMEQGKPRGIIPAAVAFKDDQIGGYSSEWYNPHLTYDYYKWESLGHISELYNHLAGMYGITNNPYFLKPIYEVARIMTERPVANIHPDTNKKGTVDWARKVLQEGGVDRSGGNNPLGKVFSMVKSLTGSDAYDSLIHQYGLPYNRYLLTGDKKLLVDALEQPLEALRYNFPLLTSEVKFTDRVYVPGSSILSGMYNGHFGSGYEYPALLVSWKNTGTDIAVLVRNGDHRKLEVLLYNSGQEKTVTMKTWQLEPGKYRIRKGFDQNDDDRIDDLLSEEIIDLQNRVNEIEIRIPSRALIIFSVEQIKSYGRFSLDKPDLAIAPRDISFTSAIAGDSLPAASIGMNKKFGTVIPSGGELTFKVNIHNIGNRPAKNVIAELLVNGSVVEQTRIAAVQPPVRLNASVHPVYFKWKAVPGKHHIGIRVKNSIAELTESNNYTDILMTVSNP